MKLSLTWILRYITPSTDLSCASTLVPLFGERVAEIEGTQEFYFPSSSFAVVQAVKEETSSALSCFNSEKGESITLPVREKEAIGKWFLIKKHHHSWQWATAADLGSEEQRLLPPLLSDPSLRDGTWRKNWCEKDIIIEIDNKSLTHRPDLWCHYGVARECAALLGKKIVPKQELLAPLPSAAHPSRLSVEIKEKQACFAFCALYADTAPHQFAPLSIIFDLCRVGASAINGPVDLANFVLLDWGQPMHLYDAQAVQGSALTIRFAQEGERISLLASTQATTLSGTDLVIADEKKALCLAGIKGGKEAAVSSATHQLIIESATFAAPIIRTTSLRHKIRSDASMRYEKSLDTQRAAEGILRFLFLAKFHQYNLETSEKMVVLVEEDKEKEISISHSFICTRLGVLVSEQEIEKLLTSIEMTVRQERKEKEIIFHVTPPLWRTSKDISIPEDLVEEIARLYGFSHIPPLLPSIEKKPSSLSPFLRVRDIKKMCAFSLGMKECVSYPFFDEQAVLDTRWPVGETLEIINPVSENQKRLVNSLVFNLLCAIKAECHEHEDLSFFEVGKKWVVEGNEWTEQEVVCGLFFSKRANVISFYKGKEQVQSLLHMCGIEKENWHLPEKLEPWMHPYQIAHIRMDDNFLGHAGMMSEAFIAPLFPDTKPSLFFFELLLEPLLRHKKKQIFAPLSPYQRSCLDLSFMVPCSITTEKLGQTLYKAVPFIKEIMLIDHFSKKEWGAERSLTFRLILQKQDASLSKEEFDKALSCAVKAATDLSCTLRGSI